jgi:hypothetical protein
MRAKTRIDGSNPSVSASQSKPAPDAGFVLVKGRVARGLRGWWRSQPALLSAALPEFAAHSRSAGLPVLVFRPTQREAAQRAPLVELALRPSDRTPAARAARSSPSSGLLEREATPSPSPERQLEFFGKLQRRFTEDDFTATYKFALLTALAELAVELGEDSGDRIGCRERRHLTVPHQYGS